MSSENNNDDDECWDVIGNIIDNANCIYEMCKRTAWFWKGFRFESGGCWGDAVDCSCGGMFWGVSGAS